MAVDVEITKVLELPDNMVHIEYEIKDPDFSHHNFNPNDPNIHQICKGSFVCKKDEINNSLRNEAKQSYNKHIAKEISFSRTKISVDNL